MLFLLLGVLVLLLDQAVKWYVSTELVPGAAVALVPGLLSVVRVDNPGAAFGLAQGRPFLLIPVSALAVIAAAFWARYRRRDPWWQAVLGIGAGGASSNLVDRLIRGFILDFIDLGFWPVFNLADLAVVLAVALILWRLWLDRGGVGE